MYTKLYTIKLSRFQVCGMSLEDFLAQSILIPQSILIMVYYDN